MKDKQAERRKRKRREAAMQTERQNAATLYAQYEAERKRLGLPKVPVKPDELMRLYRKTERDATVQAIMYGVIAAFPRACGGDPALGGGVGSLLGFSPRMRG